MVIQAGQMSPVVNPSALHRGPTVGSPPAANTNKASTATIFSGSTKICSHLQIEDLRIQTSSSRAATKHTSMASFEQILTALQSPDNQLRGQAEAAYKQQLQQNPSQVAISLLPVMQTCADEVGVE